MKERRQHKRRHAPAWFWPALISASLAVLAFFLVMVLIPGLSDSYISGSAQPAVQTTRLTEPIVTRLETETTVPVETTEVTVPQTKPPVTEPEPVPTETSRDTQDPPGSAATLLIRRAISQAKPSVLTLYVSMPERGDSPARAVTFSGVVIDREGHFVTPTSNLSFALTFNGQFHDAAVAYAYVPFETNPFEIEIVAHEPNTDVALLRIVDAPPMEPITMAEEPALLLGDFLIVLGGSDVDMTDLSLSVGYLTGLQRGTYFEDGMESGMIQTSAFVTPIMSGAALLDQNGRMVGLINSNVSRNYSDISGYALPVDVLRHVLDVLKAEEPPSLVRKVWLGIRAMDPAEYAVLVRERSYPEGLMVAEVLSDGPAASADIQRHDVIISIDGETVSSVDQLNRLLDKRLVGERVMITLYRTETRRYVNVFLYLRESPH